MQQPNIKPPQSQHIQNIFQHPNQIPPLNQPPIIEQQPSTHNILTSNFFVIHVETALGYTSTSVVPVEITIIKMNLKDGELETFHRIIDPLNLSSCHLSEILWYSENVTGIPITKECTFSAKNYTTLWNEICEFVGVPVGLTQQHIPIPSFYAKKPYYKTECLEFLCNKAGHKYYFGPVKPIEEIVWHIYMSKFNEVKTSQIENLLCQSFSTMPNENKCSFHQSVVDSKKEGHLICTLSIARFESKLLKSIFDGSVSISRI